MNNIAIIITVILVITMGILYMQNTNQFPVPNGTSRVFQEGNSGAEETLNQENIDDESNTDLERGDKNTVSLRSTRQVLVTDGVKHSIPLDEIFSGGPPKDGIPSIDTPKFVKAEDAVYLSDESIGLGLTHKGVSRFYPFSIVVWHEIVNDEILGDPILVTYCPLCATAVVFDRKIDGNKVDFGVSGRLWQSNLLMYNRSSDEKDESLWSQVLGEAVLGEFTGTKLKLLQADTVRFGDWKKVHPKTEVLSTDTGISRNYNEDPYGDYYTSPQTIFPTSFSDDRIHPKELIIGIELNGNAKAYPTDAIIVGETKDNFAGEAITITKNAAGEVRFFIGENREPHTAVWGFWFSWQAVHPDTKLYKQD